MKVTVHLAGLPDRLLVQRCTLCGHVLQDNSAWLVPGAVGVHSPDAPPGEPQGPPFWPVAERIVVSGAAGWTAGDPLEPNEEMCR